MNICKKSLSFIIVCIYILLVSFTSLSLPAATPVSHPQLPAQEVADAHLHHASGIAGGKQCTTWGEVQRRPGTAPRSALLCQRHRVRCPAIAVEPRREVELPAGLEVEAQDPSTAMPL